MNRLREKTTATLLITIFMISTMTFVVGAKPKKDYNTITEGETLYSAGHYLEGTPIPTGFDPFGYNYQGHMFKGSYYNSYAGKAGFPPWEGDDETYLDENPGAILHWAWPYREVKLTMKWNDAWLSNMDRGTQLGSDHDGAYSDLNTPDGYLDRHYPYDSYRGSGAWLTNHQSGEYELDGETIKWNYFVKIVAAPGDAYEDGGIWYTAEGVEIGSVIWGSFAIIQQVENDPGAGLHGLQYISPNCAGLGAYK